MISMPGKFRSGLIAALALLLAGCASADTSRDAGYMEILTPEVTVYSDSESGSVRFRCDGDWTAYTDESWLRLASDSGTGSDGEQELLFYPDGNTSGEERYGILSIASAAGYAAYKFKSFSLLTVAAVVVAYQVAGSLIEWAISGSLVAALQDIRLGLPGILVQVFGGYLFIKYLIGK